ncbi:MAG: hypothetical protein RJQ00_02785 [Vicingaceae bacterium]
MLSLLVEAPIAAVGNIELIEEQPDKLEKITYWVEKLKASTHEILENSKCLNEETKHIKWNNCI